MNFNDLVTCFRFLLIVVFVLLGSCADRDTSKIAKPISKTENSAKDVDKIATKMWILDNQNHYSGAEWQPKKDKYVGFLVDLNNKYPKYSYSELANMAATITKTCNEKAEEQVDRVSLIRSLHVLSKLNVNESSVLRWVGSSRDKCSGFPY